MFGQKLFLLLMTISNFNSLEPVTQEEHLVPPNCERSNNTNLMSGNLGESGFFPWMGVLRVYIVEGKKITIAVTQVILIKSSYVIAHAHDTAKLHVGLRAQSKVMFIPSNGTQWFTTVKEVMVHPEYDIYTFCTLNLIKLDWTPDDVPLQLSPACWPFDSFNSNGELYAIGFTDENQLMEKIFFKLQYSDRIMCDKFYEILQVSYHGITSPYYSDISKWLHAPRSHLYWLAADDSSKGRLICQLSILFCCRRLPRLSGMEKLYRGNKPAEDKLDMRERPTNYHCAFGVDAARDCVWENGMAMASNASGHWILLGLSISGPNCTYPGRFIDINQYTSWIYSSATLEEDGIPVEEAYST